MAVLQVLLQIPEFTTPETILSGQWEQITQMLIWLWGFAGSIVVFAGCTLLAQALIPSLVSSRDLSERFTSFKPVLMAIGLVFLVVAIFSLVQFFTELMAVYDIYPKVWI